MGAVQKISPFEIKTPALQQSRDVLLESLRQLDNGVDIKRVNARISIANSLRNHVSTDIRARIAQPRLVELESKTISPEGE